MERTLIKSQHTKLTLEKKILPPLLPGFELATFRSRVWCTYQQGPLPATAVLPQWYVKDPGHSAKSAGGRLHLKSRLTMPLSRHSVGTYPETSSRAIRQGTLGLWSQLAESLWTDPGLKSEISVHELISTL